MSTVNIPNSDEVWKVVPDFPKYEVSDLGRIRRSDTERLLTPSLHPFGYPQVRLYRNGEGRMWNVHQLVMLAFVGVPLKGQETRHLDGDTGNCRLTNLQYGTRTENCNDRSRHGRTCRGAEIWQARVTEEDVRQIRLRASKGESISQLGREFGLTPAAANNIVRRITWKHL